MKALNGYGRVPHTVWETNKLKWGEKSLLAFIIDRANKFCKEDIDFNLTYKDFKMLGIEKRQLLKFRNTLINLNLISYKEGHTGKGSIYSINWDNLENLTIEEATEKQEPKCDELVPPQLSEITKDIINRRNEDFKTILKKWDYGRKYGESYKEDAEELLYNIGYEEKVTQSIFNEMLEYVDYKNKLAVSEF